jgi:hypothetical protein
VFEKEYLILSLKNINWSLFVLEIKRVYCTVRVLSLNRSDYIPSLTFSNPIFLPIAYSPALICFER